MAAAYGQFLLITHQVPIDACALVQDAKGDERTQAAHHRQSLLWTNSASCCLDIHIAAVPFAEPLDMGNGIFLLWIDDDICAQFSSQLQAIIFGIYRDEHPWIVAFRGLEHTEADIANP